MRPNRFIWLGTQKRFDAFTFDFRKTEHGWFQAHIYQFDIDTATFIVETTEEVFEAHGLDEMDQDQSIAFCEKLFAETLDGASADDQCAPSARFGVAEFLPPDLRQLECISTAVTHRRADGRRGPYRAFRDRLRHQAGDRRCDRTGETVSRSRRHAGDDIPAALAAYEEVARASMSRASRTRRAMRWNGSRWWGRRYCDPLEPEQFMYSLLTRSQRISHENLRLRDTAWLEGYERWFAERAGLRVTAERAAVRRRCSRPIALRGLTLQNRIVVSPMAMYSAERRHARRFPSRASRRARAWAGRGWCSPR